ncbi:MAG: hypothetical protein ABH840_01550 [Nanoarchaeota archaeon]
MPKQVKKSKAKNIILAIAIAILFVMFIAYAIETIYHSPKYNSYCNPEQKQYLNQTECEENNLIWTSYPEYAPERPAPVGVSGYCDAYSVCQKSYDEISQIYNRNVFFISLTLGIITIIIAVFILLESVSSGFMAGGVLLIIYGTIRYWGSLSNWLRTIMLAFALAVLVWIGYKKLK